MKKILSTMFAFALVACGEAPQTNHTTQASSETIAVIASEPSNNNFVATKKYENIQAYYTDSNNFEFQAAKNNPLEFTLIPNTPPKSNQEIVLDDYKYAALDGLLLVFAKTDVQEVTFYIQSLNNPKLSFKAKREDVLAALNKLNIHDFDDLIEHDPNKGVIAGQSQSQAFLDLRKDSQKSWALLNAFRTDNELIGK